MVEVEACSGRDPVRVVEDLEVDEAGRPPRWPWHLECYRCGEVLDAGEALPAAAVRRSDRRAVGRRRGW